MNYNFNSRKFSIFNSQNKQMCNRWWQWFWLWWWTLSIVHLIKATVQFQLPYLKHSCQNLGRFEKRWNKTKKIEGRRKGVGVAQFLSWTNIYIPKLDSLSIDNKYKAEREKVHTICGDVTSCHKTWHFSPRQIHPTKANTDIYAFSY